MKGLKFALALTTAVLLIMLLVPQAMAEDNEGKSITITFDRKTMAQSLFHPGRFASDQGAVLTVEDYVIRDYFGASIKEFTIQTSSGQEEIPVESVKKIDFTSWISRKTKDINNVENVVEVRVYLKSGEKIETFMDADFGTIEGKTDLGDFFLKDPHTMRQIVFN